LQYIRLQSYVTKAYTVYFMTISSHRMKYHLSYEKGIYEHCTSPRPYLVRIGVNIVLIRFF